MGHTRDPCILLCYACLGINQDDAYICPVDCGNGPDHRITLDDVFDLALLAHACSIYDRERTVFILDQGVNGISCGTGDIGDDAPLGT